jgi:hypothetical protein
MNTPTLATLAALAFAAPVADQDTDAKEVIGNFTIVGIEAGASISMDFNQESYASVADCMQAGSELFERFSNDDNWKSYDLGLAASCSEKDGMWNMTYTGYYGSDRAIEQLKMKP